jgi:7-cyano-7-deazaguanine synthase
MAFWLKDQGFHVDCLSIDYGQRHRKEINAASKVAAVLGAEHWVYRMDSLADFMPQSSLMGGKPIPEGHYAEENMKSTVVPNRNTIFLSIAFAIATAQHIEVVGISVHAGDHPIYPDCRPKFIHTFEAMEWEALQGMHIPRIVSPFLTRTKIDIAANAFALKVPVALTWSCYNGRDAHCGRCGTCVERAWAIHMAGHKDPTIYEDSQYWKEVMKDDMEKEARKRK